MSSFDSLNELLNKAKGKPEVIQEFRKFSGKTFQFSTDEGDSFNLSIGADGSPALSRGSAQSPSAIIRASDSVLSDIITGRADAVRSFMMGKVKVSGDLMSVQGLVNLLKKLR
ncbi:MAG: SCP2 sterol-binding domain-containing protein [Nitrososphaeria archaeon]|jgi:putative sterol carrier protein